MFLSFFSPHTNIFGVSGCPSKHSDAARAFDVIPCVTSPKLPRQSYPVAPNEGATDAVLWWAAPRLRCTLCATTPGNTPHSLQESHSCAASFMQLIPLSAVICRAVHWVTKSWLKLYFIGVLLPSRQVRGNNTRNNRSQSARSAATTPAEKPHPLYFGHWTPPV